MKVLKTELTYICDLANVLTFCNSDSQISMFCSYNEKS